MKTLSGTFRFVVLAVIAMVVVVSCCDFPFIPQIASYCVEIGSQDKGPTYAEWKDDGTPFYRALEQVRGHNGQYCLCVIKKPGEKPQPYDYKCHSRYNCPPDNGPPGNIRTVKVTKSKAADNLAAGESAANDPNVMHRVQSPDPGDIKQVLDALATPTSMPSH